MPEFAYCDELDCCDSADCSEPVDGLLSAVKDFRPLLAVRASGDSAGVLVCDTAGLGVSFFAIGAVLFAGCCFIAAAASFAVLGFAAGEEFADCGFVDCSSDVFELFARVCIPLLAVRDASGSAGFLPCGVVGDAVLFCSEAAD